MKKAITIVLTLILIGCSDLAKNEVEGIKKDIPDQESWNTEIVITKGERRQAVINTNHLRKFNSKNLILMDNGVISHFYDSLGNKSSRLTSEKARISQNTNDLYASHNVVVESDSGVTLYTDSLTWNNETGLVRSDVPVKFITKNNDTLYGSSFRSNAQLENWTIEQPEGVTPRDIEEKINKDE